MVTEGVGEAYYILEQVFIRFPCLAESGEDGVLG